MVESSRDISGFGGDAEDSFPSDRADVHLFCSAADGLIRSYLQSTLPPAELWLGSRRATDGDAGNVSDEALTARTLTSTLKKLTLTLFSASVTSSQFAAWIHVSDFHCTDLPFF